MSSAHLVGPGPSLPRRLLAPLLLLPMLPAAPGLSLAPAARGGNQEGPPPTAPRPPACWGGTTLSQGPKAPHPTPSLSTCGSSTQPLNHHPQMPTGRALCWALGRRWGSDGGLLLGREGWSPVARTQTSGWPPPSFSPRPATAPDRPQRRDPLTSPASSSGETSCPSRAVLRRQGKTLLHSSSRHGWGREAMRRCLPGRGRPRGA